MLLGGMLMVKIGVSDRQQAPPSYPFAILSKDAGLAWNRLLYQKLRTMYRPAKTLIQTDTISLIEHVST